VALSDLVERMAREADPVAIARARAAFEATTGPFAAGEAWYEERISAFFDFALASFEHGALARAFAARPDVSVSDQRVAIAVARAERSVFEVERRGGLSCVALFGARYRLSETGTAARLQGGERFDGRLVAVEDALEIMPGAIFHPAEAHAAMDQLLAELSARGTGGRSQDAIADGLLRMRMRFDRFTSIQARHVYRLDALDRTEILAASWARPEGR
jgi:hypothetical protein